MQRFIIHYVTVWGIFKAALITAPNVTRAVQMFHNVKDAYKIVSINKG